MVGNEQQKRTNYTVKNVETVAAVTVTRAPLRMNRLSSLRIDGSAAAALGLNLQSLLTLSMTIAVMTGLFHIDMLKLKFARARSVWEWIHFGIAATMVPLIA